MSSNTGKIEFENPYRHVLDILLLQAAVEELQSAIRKLQSKIIAIEKKLRESKD